jgi:hypothetical protein
MASKVMMVDNQKYITVPVADYPAACDGGVDVKVGGGASADGTSYIHTATHVRGSGAVFTVSPGTGVVRGAAITP